MTRTIPNFIVKLLLGTLLCANASFAAWTLDNDASELTVVSTKAVDIAEVHRFTALSGRVSDRGDAVVTVTLDTISTGIDIRNERMREMLFETGKYPLATVRAEIEKDILFDMSAGQSSRMDIRISLSLHGKVMPMDAAVLVTRLNDNTMIVSSTAPLIVNAASFDLSDGIEALRAVANLPSIGNAVPVSFVLTFRQ